MKMTFEKIPLPSDRKHLQVYQFRTGSKQIRSRVNTDLTRNKILVLESSNFKRIISKRRYLVLGEETNFKVNVSPSNFLIREYPGDLNVTQINSQSD